MKKIIKKHIPQLDALRGLAAVLVMFYHYNINYLPSFLSDFFLIRQGWIFVDFFFVLSGFVITYNYSFQFNKKTLFKFIKLRFIRIYPLLFFSVIVFAFFIIVLFSFSPENLRYFTTKESIINGLLEPLLLVNSTPFLGNSQGINDPTWSISAEFISYFIFAIISLLNIKSRKWIALILVFLSYFFLYISFDKGLYLTGDYGFVRGIGGFNLGVLVFMLYDNLKIKISEIYVYIFAVLIIICLNLINVNHDNFTLLFPFIFSFFIFLIAKSKNSLIISFLLTKPLQYLGKISFSIYLNHKIVFLLMTKTIFMLFPNEQSQTLLFIVLLLCLFVVLVYSNYTYKIIELRFSKYLKTKII